MESITLKMITFCGPMAAKILRGRLKDYDAVMRRLFHNRIWGSFKPSSTKHRVTHEMLQSLEAIKSCLRMMLRHCI